VQERAETEREAGERSEEDDSQVQRSRSRGSETQENGIGHIVSIYKWNFVGRLGLGLGAWGLRLED
jgi:hypothetical protein